jgi:hypothetical protein
MENRIQIQPEDIKSVNLFRLVDVRYRFGIGFEMPVKVSKDAHDVK